MAFKDLKALGGTPEFQEMMKKLLAEQDAEKTQETAETPVADKKETAVDDTTVAKIEEDLKNQKREIISSINSMFGKRDTENKRDKKSTQVSLTKISSRLTSIDDKLTRILNTITNIGKTISKSYDLQKERFNNYELDKAKRVDDTKESSRGGKEYTAVKDVDSGGLLKYLPLVLVLGTFLTSYFSKWLKDKKSELDSIFSPITSLFLKNSKLFKFTSQLAGTITEAGVKSAAAITSATQNLAKTLNNLTSKFLQAIGKEKIKLPGNVPAPGVTGTPRIPGLPEGVTPEQVAKAREIAEGGRPELKLPEQKVAGNLKSRIQVRNAATANAKANAPALKAYEKANEAYNNAKKLIATVNRGLLPEAAKATKEFGSTGEALRAVLRNAFTLPNTTAARTFADRAAATIKKTKEEVKLINFISKMKTSSRSLLLAGLAGATAGGAYAANELTGGNEELGAVGGGTAFVIAVNALKKVIKWTKRTFLLFTLLYTIKQALISTGIYLRDAYYADDKIAALTGAKQMKELSRGYVKTIGAIVGLFVQTIIGTMVGAYTGAAIGATIGGALGLLLGIFGGPAGMAFGAIGGIVSGGISGTTVGGTAGALASGFVFDGVAFGEEAGGIIFSVFAGEITAAEGVATITGRLSGLSKEQAKRVVDVSSKTYDAVYNATGYIPFVALANATGSEGLGRGIQNFAASTAMGLAFSGGVMMNAGKNSLLGGNPDVRASKLINTPPPSTRYVLGEATPSSLNQLSTRPIILSTTPNAPNQQQPVQSGFPYLSAFKLPTAVDNITVSSATP
jgi:hypothetical protein